jgi:hypothetical protein
MNHDELETMMHMLLEGGDMVSVLDPIPSDLLPVGANPAANEKAGCSDVEEKCCELV